MPPESLQAEVAAVEDWLDETIGIVTRFLDCQFRTGINQQIDLYVLSKLVIQLARPQSASTRPDAKLGEFRPSAGRDLLHPRWQDNRGTYSASESLRVADITAVAWLNPLAWIRFGVGLTVLSC